MNAGDEAPPPTIGDPSDAVARYQDELHHIARRELSRVVRSGTIDTVALVNEAFLRIQGKDGAWADRGHFLGAMTRVMRHVLVDYARERQAQKRGGDWLKVTTGGLENEIGAASPVDVLALHQALEALGKRSERLERLVELKVFGGLTLEELAEALGISTATVSRELRVASACLRGLLSSAP